MLIKSLGMLIIIWQIVSLTASSSSICETTLLKGINELGKINCVLSDMDGTLLRKERGVSMRNLDAITKLKSTGIPFFPATGRTRLSMTEAAGRPFIERLGGDIRKISGVYSQGLMVYGREGSLIYEHFLDNDVIEFMESYCQHNMISLIAYAGERILTTEQTVYTRLIAKYEEPTPELHYVPLHRVNRQRKQINKLIMLESEDILVGHRPIIESQLLGRASVIRAMANMLEVLPYGTSKGDGVRVLLEHFNINPDECIAFGDGENDIEMMQLVKYGVAVDNACPELKKHTKLVTHANQDDGVAFVLENLYPQWSLNRK